MPLTVADAPSFRDCIHCGLCLESCPTYLETAAEAESPRGRIVIMRALAERRLAAEPAALRHLDLCLDCRACETACPSGVRYGELIEKARAEFAQTSRASRGWFARLRDHVMFQVLPYPKKLRRWVIAWRLAEAVGLPRAIAAFGLDRFAGMAPLPALPADSGEPPLRTRYRATGGATRPVEFFAGCVGEVLAARTNRATIRVLQRTGSEVHCPAGQVCCGAIHYHAGRAAEARRLARANIDAFGGDALIIVNVAGCGAMLKQYGHLLRDDAAYAGRAAAFAARVRDVSEWLMAGESVALKPKTPSPGAPRLVTYHDPCHLCHAQGIRRQPRELLRKLPGVELVPLAESEVCCGAAGTYSLMQPEMSARLARRKWENIRRSKAQVVATGNIGCILQLRQHCPADLRAVRVCHPVDLVDEARHSGPNRS